MPKSRVRKKKGKKVRGHDGGSRIRVDPNKESNVTFQDLIDILAYQEYRADGTISDEQHEENKARALERAENPQASEIFAKVPWGKDDVEVAPGVILRADAIVTVPDEIEVNIENERGEKIGVGTAAPIEGDPEHLSIMINDPHILRRVQGPVDHYSIDKENSQ